MLILRYCFLSVLLFTGSQILAQNNIAEKHLDSANYYLQTNSDSSMYYARLALNTIKGNEDIRLRSLVIIAELLNNQNYYDSALIFNQKVISDIENRDTISQNTAQILSTAYNNIAEIHTDLKSLDEATLYNKKSFEITRQYQLNTRKINCLITKGKIAYMQDSSQRARIYWHQGLNLADSLKNLDLSGRLLNNLGSLYYHEQKHDLCINYYKKAYNIQEKLQNEIEQVRTANNIGMVYYMKKDFNKAIVYLNQAQKLGEKNNMLNSQAMSYYYLIQTNMYLNKPEKSAEYFTRFEETLDEIYNTDKQKSINELEIKYQVANKNKEIELLEKQKIIDKLMFEKKLSYKNKLIGAGIFFVAVILLIIWFWFQNYKKGQTINRQKLMFQKLETEQKMLRSQMNPHFIFNSLSSIQSFITANNSVDAEKYLTRFSRLLRGILENSRLDFISLDKEIEMLDLYLNLEQMRFDKEFNYSITVDENCETDYVMLPPMLIQPFVENAIIHGLKSVPNGTISIAFQENDDILICTIDDNGIGRSAAAKNGKAKEHQSLATKITEERLATLSQKVNKPAYFNIIDKLNPDTQKPEGTKVILNIPLAEI